MRIRFCAAAALVLFAITSVTQGGVMITEWMYNGLATVPSQGGEFVEITNTGLTSIDMSNYSFDDSSRTAGSQSLSAFGLVLPGESVIFTDMPEATFRTNWGLAPSVKIIGGNGNNLGRADEINIYDGMNPLTAVLIDRLTYDDQLIGGPRTSTISGKILPANYGLNLGAQAVASMVGDGISYQSGLLEVANPGVVPEPASLGLVALLMTWSLKRPRR